VFNGDTEYITQRKQ